MSHPIEDRLRDAYQAKAAQLTEQRLDQLTAAREQGLDGLFASESEHTAELPALDFDSAAARRAQHHWIAPALAAAAVAALAIGVTAVSGMHATPRPRPNPPASHVSTPPPPTSAPAPSASASQTHIQTIVGPPYLPAGQTGSRSQVPWSAVGSGWRLMQRQHFTGTGPTFDNSVYLYDPAGGRYRITDSLPPGVRLSAWSPDGNRAMFITIGQGNTTFYQLSLRSGSVSRLLRTGPANFIGYSRPQGLAFVAEVPDDAGSDYRISRYSVDGSLELSYPRVVNGITLLWTGGFYSADGSELVVGNEQDGSAVLIGNDGHFIRTFAAPSGYRGCTPVKLWKASSMLEHCGLALVVQPLSGGAAWVLAAGPGRNATGYWNAWQLSNGDVLLHNWSSCDRSTYDILDAGTGVIRPLHWPSGIPAGSTILNVSGDIATFEHRTPGGCGNGVSQVTLYSYNLLTGQTSKLVDSDAVIFGWPGASN